MFGELAPNTASYNEFFDSESQNQGIHCIWQCLVKAHQTLPVTVFGELSQNTASYNEFVDFETQNQRIHCV